MLGRKTARPHFSRFFLLTHLFGMRIPHIHITLSYDRLVLRKDEMTESGHATYDRLLFDCFSIRSPTDYLLFENSGTLDESTERLVRIIDSMAEA